MIHSMALHDSSQASQDEHPEPNYQVRGITRALRLLTHMSRVTSDCSLRDAARVLDVQKSTALRILATLTNEGFVERDPGTGNYRLGVRTVEIAAAYLGSTSITQVATPHLNALATQFGITANLGILDGSWLIYIASVEGTKPFAVRAATGIRTKAHCSSAGKALLATLSDDDLEGLYPGEEIDGFTDRSIRTLSQLREALAIVRKQGYALDEGETQEGVRCVGAAIYGHIDQPIAGLSVSGLAFNVTSDEMPLLSDAVVRHAAEISRQMGQQPKRTMER